MQGMFPEDPTDFEVTESLPNAEGVAKTPFGWYPLTELTLTGNTVTVTFSTGKEIPPAFLDLQIVRRALEILSKQSTWNRNEARTCPARATTWSLYCSLVKATLDVEGKFHYRRPALQVVRRIVGDIGGARINRHRLMEYNNHPDTTFQDIQSVLRKAEEQIAAQLRGRP